MRLLSVLPLTLILAACGGGSGGSGGDDSLGDGGNPGGGTIGIGSKRDCSVDQWHSYGFPMPEYPGYLLQTYITGFNPEHRFDDVREALIEVVDAMDDGRDHQGPIWTTTNNDELTSTINYSNDNGVESWTLTLDGGPGYDYGHGRNYTIRQLADCTLEFEGYDPANKELEVDYSAGREESKWTQYFEEKPERVFKTRINPDLSGKTVDAKIGTTEAHPVSIITWNSNEERTLLETCEDYSGYTCIGPATAIAGN